MTMTVSCFIAPPFYREAVHGEGKHRAGLQAGTPGDEREIVHGGGKHRAGLQAGSPIDESPCKHSQGQSVKQASHAV